MIFLRVIAVLIYFSCILLSSLADDETTIDQQKTEETTPSTIIMETTDSVETTIEVKNTEIVTETVTSTTQAETTIAVSENLKQIQDQSLSKDNKENENTVESTTKDFNEDKTKPMHEDRQTNLLGQYSSPNMNVISVGPGIDSIMNHLTTDLGSSTNTTEDPNIQMPKLNITLKSRLLNPDGTYMVFKNEFSDKNSKEYKNVARDFCLTMSYILIASNIQMDLASCEVINLINGSVIIRSQLTLISKNETYPLEYNEPSMLIATIKQGLKKISEEEIKSLGMFIDQDSIEIESLGFKINGMNSASLIHKVDQGAIKHILKGSNIMCPGLTSQGGRLSDVPINSIVVIMAEGKEHALAIGQTAMAVDDIVKVNQGIAVNLLHYLNDGLWRANKFPAS